MEALPGGPASAAAYQFAAASVAGLKTVDDALARLGKQGHL
jgi:hypothetical protein